MAGRDYPRTLREFNVWFPDDEACLGYLARLRWPGGFGCSVCGATSSWRMSKGRNLRCASCRADSSITAGTIFADTRLPLTTWFAAAWHVCSQKPGVTAWSLLHKLRRAMVRPGRELLAGELEVDESYVCRRLAAGKRGRGAAGKAIVAIAVEALPRGAAGRIRLARIRDCSQPVLTDFVSAVAAPGSIIYTDHSHSYNRLAEASSTTRPTSPTAPTPPT